MRKPRRTIIFPPALLTPRRYQAHLLAHYYLQPARPIFAKYIGANSIPAAQMVISSLPEQHFLSISDNWLYQFAKEYLLIDMNVRNGTDKWFIDDYLYPEPERVEPGQNRLIEQNGVQ